MLKPIQSSENVKTLPTKNFKGTNSNPRISPAQLSQIEAAEYKFNLACLLAAQTQLENTKLKQELATTQALQNYYRACG